MDELAAALHSLGWSCGDVAFRIGDRVVWQFYGARGEQRVIVHAKLVPKNDSVVGNNNPSAEHP